MKLYLGTGAALLGYLVLAWLADSALHLDTSRFYLLFAILAVLGIGGAVVFIWFWSKIRPQSGGGAGAAGRDDEIDSLVRDAEGRLASSNLAQGAKLSNLPVVFVIGEPGSTKTSTLLNSGLDPELLAGNVYQDNAVAPTRVANIWFARGMVFVEAGGKLLSEPGRWARLLQRLQPRGQAPRAALLCFDAETFTRPGSAESLTAAARTLQARLGEISQRFGISFPVYVLFTKMNRVAFFEDFVRDLGNQEAGQVLGATLPMAQPGATGIYAEVETRRLSAAFDGLFYSLPIAASCCCRGKTIRKKSPAPTSFRANSASCATAWCNSWWMSAAPASCAPALSCADFISPACGRWWCRIRQWRLPGHPRNGRLSRPPAAPRASSGRAFRRRPPGRRCRKPGCPLGPAAAKCRNGFFWATCSATSSCAMK